MPRTPTGVAGRTSASQRHHQFRSHNTALLAATAQVKDLGVSICYLNNTDYEQNVHTADGTLRRLTSILGGHALLGPLAAAPVLLVEGDDDYEIWSNVPRHPASRHAFSVVSGNGDEIVEHQRVLEALFGALREPGDSPAGYALLDGGKGIPTHLPTDHVPFIRLNCHEAENLYLPDQVLGRIGTTWSDLKRELLARAEDFGEKAERLRELAGTEDRLQADLKGLMVPLTQLADDKGVPWAMRVGQTLGSGEPTGDLRAALGEDVVQALWPAGAPGF